VCACVRACVVRACVCGKDKKIQKLKCLHVLHTMTIVVLTSIALPIPMHVLLTDHPFLSSCVCLCVCVCVSVCVSECVCVCEREREWGGWGVHPVKYMHSFILLFGSLFFHGQSLFLTIACFSIPMSHCFPSRNSIFPGSHMRITTLKYISSVQGWNLDSDITISWSIWFSFSFYC
jgi:hypothetical protein